MGWIKKRILLAKINKAHEHWRKIEVRYELFEKKGESDATKTKINSH
jgi:hypothetical protein